MEQILVAIVSWIVIILTPLASPDILPPNRFATQSDNPGSGARVSYQGTTYYYWFFRASDYSQLSLIPNFSSSHSAQTLAANNSCQNLINASFYTPQNQPLGWFISDTESFPQQHPSGLIDGYYYIDADGTAHISRQLPGHPVALGVQSGPLLIADSLPQTLTLVQDELRRRSVVSLDSAGTSFFFLISTGERTFEGPLLEDLPELMSAISRQENLNLTAALNLDGGSTSAYLDSTTTIDALRPIGSVFCLR